MSAGPTHYYVWYLVDVDRAAALAAVGALLAAVEDATGIAGRVLARRDEPGTWMEIYENVADTAAFERTLAALVKEHAIGKLAGARHVERFAALTDIPGAVPVPVPTFISMTFWLRRKKPKCGTWSSLNHCFASRLYVLDFGTLIASGSTDEVMGDTAVRRAYLGEMV